MLTAAHERALQLARDAEQAAFLGHHSSAESLIKSADSHSDSPSVSGAISLARAELAFGRSQFEVAAALAEKAISALNIAGLATDALRAEEMLPRVWARQGQEDKVLAKSQTLLGKWRRLESNAALEGQVRCLTLITFMHTRKFRYDEGIASGEQAVALARRTQNIATLLPRAGNALAGLHFAKACALHPSTGWASHLTSLAPTDQPDVLVHCRAAMALLQEVQPYSRTNGNVYQDALIGSNMAQLRVLMGDPDRAIPEMEHFLAVTRERRNVYMEADALQAIGWAHLVAGRLQEAREAMVSALGLAVTLRAKPLLVTLHYDLSVILEQLGEVAKALNHYRAYARLWGQVHHQLPAPQSPHVRRRLEPFYLKRAEAFIRASLPLSPTAEEIADYAGASVRAIQVAFREYRGTSPHAASLAIRYENARDVLAKLEVGSNVGNVCTELGFDDPSRFAREFRKRFGILPSAWVREQRRGKS